MRRNEYRLPGDPASARRSRLGCVSTLAGGARRGRRTSPRQQAGAGRGDVSRGGADRGGGHRDTRRPRRPGGALGPGLEATWAAGLGLQGPLRLTGPVEARLGGGDLAASRVTQSRVEGKVGRLRAVFAAGGIGVVGPRRDEHAGGGAASAHLRRRPGRRCERDQDVGEPTRHARSSRAYPGKKRATRSITDAGESTPDALSLRDARAGPSPACGR